MGPRDACEWWDSTQEAPAAVLPARKPGPRGQLDVVEAERDKLRERLAELSLAVIAGDFDRALELAESKVVS